MKYYSPPAQTRFGACGDNNSAYIHPKTAPPFLEKYKKSRNDHYSPMTAGFIKLKECHQVRMFETFLKGRFADQIIAIKEKKMYTKIYDIRTKFRISQPELAKRSGVSQSQISKYEKGEIAKPSHDKLIRIAEALNCSVEDITDELDEKIKPAFQSFNSPGVAIFIPHYSEVQQMNKVFSAGDGVVIRPEAAQAQIRKPSFLEYSDKAYAITTYSEEMQPRYSNGDILYVDPTLTAMKGDDAILLFQLEGRLVGIVREVVEMGEMQISVKDVKSNKTVNFSLTELYEVHVIVGSQRRRG